jgi:transposase
VVERTFAWLDRFRRLTVRYERRADLHLALQHSPSPSSACDRSEGFVLSS